MSDSIKPQEDPRDDSLLSEEELEAVSGGCQQGNDTTGPKIPTTETQYPTTDPFAPYTILYNA